MSEEQISSQTSDTPPPFAAVWFAVVRGEKQGPLTVPDVGALMEQGTIERHTLMWKAGMAEWRPAGQLPELDLFSTASKKRSAMDDERIQRALEVSKHSSKEAFEAGKTFVVNPLDGVAATYKTLGKTGSLGVSVVFIVVYELAVFLGLGVLRWSGISLMDYLKLFVAFAIPYGGIMASLFVIRKVKNSGETWHADLYVSASAAVLGGIGAGLAGLIGMANFELVLLIVLVEFCVLVYVLHSGLGRIYEYGEIFTIWLTPTIIVASLWLGKIAAMSILSGYADRFLKNLPLFL